MAIKDDGLAIEDDESAAGIDKRMDVDDGSDARANNQSDARLDNRPDMGLIIIITGDIRANLINNFNNGVFVVALTELSRIIPDKYVIDSPVWIFVNVINNLFGDLSPLLMALSFPPLLLPLPAPTTGNSGNISTTFIYYMLIYIQDLVSSQWFYPLLSSFSICLSQLLTIPIIFSQLSLTTYLFVHRIF